jgi:peptidoglycan hydrolase CwlO-like protein
MLSVWPVLRSLVPLLRRPLFLVASRRAQSVVLVALLAGSIALTALPAAAQTDPFDQQISEAQAQVDAAQAAAHAIADRVEAAKEQRAALEAQVAEVQAKIADLQAKIPALQAQVRELRAIVRQRAAVLYANSGPWSDDATFSIDPSIKAERKKALADAAAKQDDDTMKQLKATVAQLKQVQVELAAEQTQLAQQQAALAQVETQLASEQADLQRKVDIANAALERARALGALRARGEPVEGPTILTGAQMAGWWHTRSYSFRVPGSTIESIAQTYVEEGRAENVRGDLAFAQAIVETGGFSAAPANNFAGMGWCDSCSTGRQFPSARDGIRAQIQHLKNYADSTSRASGLAYPPSPYWYGSNPATAIHNFDTFFAKGWAPTWNDMGHGNWATDKTYAGKVLKVYADMVAFAQTHG